MVSGRATSRHSGGVVRPNSLTGFARHLRQSADRLRAPEFPDLVARAYADARVVKIAGGSIEIMKTIIARQMFAQRGHSLPKSG